MSNSIGDDKKMEPAKNPGEVLSQPQFSMFRDFFYKVTGVFIGDDKKYFIDSRVKKRMKVVGLEAPLEYLSLLRMQGSQSAMNEYFEFINELTTHETYFFRSVEQMSAFKDVILPELIENARKTGKKELRLWSAACSTGDEPYTLAILIHEKLKDELRDWKIDILGTDISPNVIHIAQFARYGFFSLRSIPAQYLDKYFTVIEKDFYELVPQIKEMVTFKVQNVLNCANTVSQIGAQVIFFRNTMIYFDEASKKKVANCIYDVLSPGGYLILGHSETFERVDSRFQVVTLPQCIVYRKPGRLSDN